MKGNKVIEGKNQLSLLFGEINEIGLSQNDELMIFINAGKQG